MIECWEGREVTLEGVTYVATKTTANDCVGCAFRTKKRHCDKVMCTVVTDKGYRAPQMLNDDTPVVARVNVKSNSLIWKIKNQEK